MENTATRERVERASRPLALIAAGGEGKRLGSIGPKALVVCADRPLLAWCLDAFAASAAFADGAGVVVVAAHASDLPAFEAACVEARENGLQIELTTGGPSRSHSVAAALAAGQRALEGDATGGDDRIVLVQDAARIFTDSTLVDGIVSALAGESPEVAGMIAAQPVTDTIKLVGDDEVIHDTPPRERLWAVQTPQVFRELALADALSTDDETLAAATDDASLVEANGGAVKVFAWTAHNVKITTAEDLATADAQLRSARDASR